MSNKLKNKEIKDISRKLRWSLKNTKEAIKEFNNVESIVNHDELLRICLISNNPTDRINNIAEILVLKEDDNIENILLKVLDIDDLLYVLRVFNIADFVFNNNIKVEIYSFKFIKFVDEEDGNEEDGNEEYENENINESSDEQSAGELI